MTKTRSALLVGVLLITVSGLWIFFARPEQVDMATYAPADSLLYIEANHPSEIVEAIAGTEAWKDFEGLVGPLASPPGRPWIRNIVANTGIGPIQSVILARAQIAIVLTDLRTSEEGETLNVKPEGTLLIETHTASSRVRPIFEAALSELAEKTYERPTLHRTSFDGVEYLEWLAPENSRRIVGALAGSLVVIGTSEQAVRNCLNVARGGHQSLKDDPELHQMRLQIKRQESLSFGYVPRASSAKLLGLGLPALIGRAPGDAQFQGLISRGAARIFGSFAWSSQSYSTGIEDRYLITLQEPVGARLKASFQTAQIEQQHNELIPNNAYSITSYNLANPVEAWQGLNATVSSQVDTLSTVVFSALLKSSLAGYGLDDPESFLACIGGRLLTIRLDENDERSLLVAEVRDDAMLRRLIKKNLSAKPSVGQDNSETFRDPSGEMAARLGNGIIVMGSPEDVARYFEGINGLEENDSRPLTFYSSSDHAPVVTYTNDAPRVRSFVASVLAAKGVEAAPTEQSEKLISSLPYSVTETTFTDRGLERVTKSPLGQFSTLFPLLIPEKARSTLRSTVR